MYDNLFLFIIKGIINDEGTIEPVKNEKLRQKWRQWQARFRKMFWDQLQKRAATLPFKRQRVHAPVLSKNTNEFQRKNRQSRAMTILRTIAPQFQNGVDPKLQRRIWQDVMAAANTNKYGNEIDVIENEGIHQNGKKQHDSNGNWITLLKSEEPSRNVNNYHYAYNVQRPLNAQSQVEPQVYFKRIGILLHVLMY